MFTAVSALANTTTITIFGKYQRWRGQVPAVSRQFHSFLAMSKAEQSQDSCSYDGMFSFSYDLADPSVQRGFS